MGVVSAIISAAAATWGGVAIGTAATASTFLGLSAVGSFLARAAIGVALYALQPKPNTGSANRGYQVTTRGSAVDHQIVYGEAKVGGVVVFDNTTGTDNKFLHRVLAFTGHEIEAFSDIYINDSRVTDLEVDGNVKEVTDPDGTTSNRYDGKMRINKHLGATDQSADSDLVSEVTEWTNDHRLRGVSYLYVRFKFDQDAYPNGVPEVTAVVKGKKVYDPRSDTTVWSDNPALCLRDYLSEGYGLNEADANIDDTLVTTAANVCDETTSVSGATRYTCNGSFTTGATPYDTLNALMTSMGGLLWYAQGEWRMKAADYVAPSVVFTEDDLRSNIQVATRHSRRDNFNTVKGTFRGEESDWQVTDYPEVSNSAFVTADGGQESVMDLDLPFTDTSGEARRLALIALERNRQQLTVNASFGLKAFKVQVGDIVQLSIDRFGWTQKEFEVISWTFGLTDGLDLQAQMTLREISESVFDEIDDGIVYERDNTTLLSPFDVPQPALNAPTVTTTVNEDGTTVPEILFSWGVSSDEVIDHYDFQWKLTSETNYKTTNLTGTEFLLTPAISGVSYDYRVRASNSFGVNSPFTSSVSPVSTGDDGTTPNAPSNVTAGGGYASATVTWDAPTQNTDGSALKDLFQYKIYRGTSPNPTTLVGRVSGEAFTESGLDDNQTYYYRVKALDFTGNESAYSADASATTNPQLQDGADGADGADGERGPGRWHVGVTTLPTTSSGAHTDFTNAIGDPVNLDQAWFYTGTLSNPTSQTVWIYEEGSGATPADSWNEQEEVIDGDLLVAGTVTADKVASNAVTTDKLAANSVSSVKIASSIESDNFVSGEDGWSISRSTGSAEFNDITVRGDVINLNEKFEIGISGNWYQFSDVGTNKDITSILDQIGGAGTYAFILVGAGGGGAAASQGLSHVASGGGGGALANFIYEWDGTTALTVDIGGGGAGGSATGASGDNGNTGGTSRFKIAGTTRVTTTGGSGGVQGSNTASGGAGGTVTYSSPSTYFPTLSRSVSGSRGGNITTADVTASGGGGIDAFGFASSAPTGGDTGADNSATSGGGAWGSGASTSSGRVYGATIYQPASTTNYTSDTLGGGLLSSYGVEDFVGGYGVRDNSADEPSAGQNPVFCGGGAHSNGSTLSAQDDAFGGDGGIGGGGGGAVADATKTGGDGGSGALFISRIS